FLKRTARIPSNVHLDREGVSSAPAAAPARHRCAGSVRGADAGPSVSPRRDEGPAPRPGPAAARGGRGRGPDVFPPRSIALLMLTRKKRSECKSSVRENDMN